MAAWYQHTRPTDVLSNKGTSQLAMIPSTIYSPQNPRLRRYIDDRAIDTPDAPPIRVHLETLGRKTRVSPNLCISPALLLRRIHVVDGYPLVDVHTPTKEQTRQHQKPNLQAIHSQPKTSFIKCRVPRHDRLVTPILMPYNSYRRRISLRVVPEQPNRSVPGHRCA